jgi:hypothetical protein
VSAESIERDGLRGSQPITPRIGCGASGVSSAGTETFDGSKIVNLHSQARRQQKRVDLRHHEK